MKQKGRTWKQNERKGKKTKDHERTDKENKRKLMNMKEHEEQNQRIKENELPILKNPRVKYLKLDSVSKQAKQIITENWVIMRIILLWLRII